MCAGHACRHGVSRCAGKNDNAVPAVAALRQTHGVHRLTAPIASDPHGQGRAKVVLGRQIAVADRGAVGFNDVDAQCRPRTAREQHAAGGGRGVFRVETEFKVLGAIGLDIVGHDDDVWLDEQQAAVESLQAQFLRICFRRVSLDVVNFWRGTSRDYVRITLGPQLRQDAEPFPLLRSDAGVGLVLAKLAVPVDQQRVVVFGDLETIAVISQQPLAMGEEDEVRGIGMGMGGTWIVVKTLGRAVAQGGSALQHQQ